MRDTPKLWRHMTPEEKGALLLAHHEGRKIECCPFDVRQWRETKSPCWAPGNAYRVKTEPKQETVTLWGGPEYNWRFDRVEGAYDTHRITFDLIDGEPDRASIRMERIK